MGWLVWAGVGMTVLGLIGLIWCIVSVARAKKAGLSDEAMRGHLQRVVVYNMSALFTSALGLMLVILGLFLR